MRTIAIIILLFLVCCDRDTSKYGFSNGDAVTVGGKYDGVVYKAKKGNYKDEYVCVTWINGHGQEEFDCIHYKLIKKK
jgi:hypothetical protein